MTSNTQIINNHIEEWKRTVLCPDCKGALIKDAALCVRCDGFGKVYPAPPDTTQEAA